MTQKLGKDICERSRCTGCSACVAVCPKQCITIVDDINGFGYPEIDSEKCINCNRCREVCPVKNKPLMSISKEFTMGWNNDDNVIMNSSSGGFFPAIARTVLDKEGYVVGVKNNNPGNNAVFSIIQSAEDIHLFQKSKYYQVPACNVYRPIMDKLKTGHKVLFSGTPCQVAGLKNYLKVNACSDVLLLTVEVICHGVTSKRVVDAYIRDLQAAMKSEIEHIDFRHKDNGWALGKSTNIKVFAKNGISYPVPKNKDFFFYAFNSNVILRESCYQCPFASRERCADLTMGDYWRVADDRLSVGQLDKGVSAVLFNTDKALSNKKEIQKYFTLLDADPEDMIIHNQTLSAPSTYNSLRPKFFSLMNKKGYYYAFKRCFIKYFIKLQIYDFLGPELVAKVKRIIGK